MLFVRELGFTGAGMSRALQPHRLMTIRSGAFGSVDYKTPLRVHIDNYLRNRGVSISHTKIVGASGTNTRDYKTKGPDARNHSIVEEDPPDGSQSVRDHALERVWTIPNMMTMTRVALSPWLAYEIMQGNYVLAFSVFTIGASLDYFDGWVARRFNQKSLLGSYLDPAADKILVACTFLPLTISGAISPTLAALVISRDATLIGASVYARHITRVKGEPFFNTSTVSNVSVEPTLLSKANTVLQMGLVTTTLAGLAMEIPMLTVGSVFMDSLSLATGITTAWSFVDYYRLSGTRLKQLQDRKRQAEKNV